MRIIRHLKSRPLITSAPFNRARGILVKHFFIAWVLAATPVVTLASPVSYDVTFTATTGPSGIGQLTWDSSTLLMSGFSWDFGAGRIGSFTDAALATVIPTDLGTIGALVWENITGEDVSQVDSFLTLFGAAFSPGTTFPSGDSPGLFFNTGTYVAGDLTTDERFSAGAISVHASTAIPEPGSLALLAMGLAVVLTRKKLSAAV
jgi:hypothetical protein